MLVASAISAMVFGIMVGYGIACFQHGSQN